MANSIIGLFEETAAKQAARTAARFKDKSGQWVTRTWGEFASERKVIAAALIELGLKEDERVNVLANTSFRWMVADLAIQSAGGETVAIYQSNLPDECEYIILDSGGAMVFVENKEQLDKLLKVKANIPAVRKVIVMNDETDGTSWTIGWSELDRIGREKLKHHEPEIARRIAGIGRDDILTLIYTSGTTGRPKGVMLTHGNMLYEHEAVSKISLISPDDVELLFLPMAHSFAKVLQCVWLGEGHEMAIDADLNAITANMAVVRPTVMASVPRIFEKVYAKVTAGGLEAPGMKGKLFKWALETSDRYAQLRIEGHPIPFGLQLQLNMAKSLVFSKVTARLNDLFGGKLRYFISGGAPLSKKIAFFFDNAGISILEGFGLTETSAATCVNRPGKAKIGTVGPAVPGTELKIASDGEILIRGPGVMKGYWNKEEATREVLTPDGWFSTGDIGEIDAEGYLKITDRKKDIIVTAGGKNVAPQNLENLLKATSPLISQAMIIGDKRKYLVAVLTLETDNLKKFCADRGVSGDYASQTAAAPVRQEVERVMQVVNNQLPAYETIKKFHILPKDFEIGDELTPTLKVKRKHATAKYKTQIDAMYDEAVAD
ncbi:MAG: long-chain fatty acid--CoA ligase [Deltaproteobacteria bacterium]|nr:long-chain fatty acid--CoA ligase [Deltaproteobacteria bacterium]